MQTGRLSSRSMFCPGLLVPDIPLEETGEIREEAAKAGLELILLTTPTTPRDRVVQIAKASQGFVYLVSVTGMSFSGNPVASATPKVSAAANYYFSHMHTTKSSRWKCGINSSLCSRRVCGL